MQKLVIFVAVLATLVGCSSETSSSPDVKQIIDAQIAKPGCATSSMFEHFPVTLSRGFGPGIAEGNGHVFDAFVKVGLLRKAGPLTYDLTDAGMADYKPDRKGFCFASGYQVTNVKDVRPMPADQVGVAVEAGWLATVEISPKDIKPWIKDPALKQAGGSITYNGKEVSEPTVHRVTIVKRRGEQQFIVLNANFLNEVTFGQGF